MKLSSRSKALIKLVVALGFATIVAVVALAQQGSYVPPDYTKMKVSSERDDVWFETNVGSFKILPRGDVLPSGDLTMSFSGSVLVSELNGTITPEGAVRREYHNKAKGKEVWFGTGKLTIKGSFRAVQWFGRNLKAKFNGNGYMRLYGEFDKNLNTGNYWFDPKEKRYWGNYGTGFGVPEAKNNAPSQQNNIKTREEFDKGKAKGGGKG
jgi:hypothetical protein